MKIKILKEGYNYRYVTKSMLLTYLERNAFTILYMFFTLLNIEKKPIK